MKSIYTVLLFVTITSGCNESEYRPEEINKLRAFGFENNTIVTPPSVEGEAPTTITTTLHLAVPIDQEVTLKAFVDQPSAAATNLTEEQISIDTTTENYTDYKHFRHYTVDVDLTVPSSTFLLTPLGPKSGLQVRYGVSATTNGDEESVLGTFLMYQPGSEELNWKSPTIEITGPKNGDKIKKSESQEITLTVGNKNDEDYKAGWFVTSGEVSNRRAYTTNWKEMDSGTQTLIATIRGKKSKSFQIKIIEVTVEE